jgi:hypothetical protein
MRSTSNFVLGLVNSWRRAPCFYCHQTCEPWWMSLFSTYSIQCEACGGVLEWFELYRDPRGELYTERHRWAVAPASGVGPPVLWPL